MRRLLLGFEHVEAMPSSGTENVCHDGEEICTVYGTKGLSQHGVECLTASHPVHHVLGLTRCPSAVLQADADFRHLTVRAEDDEGLSESMLIGIYSRLIHYKTVFFHAALVDAPDLGGVMFIGRSGVGKTTQARLWHRRMGADIINGDKVFLGLRPEFPGQVMAYGSPWRGSSEYCINRRVPLRGIVSLVRRDEQYIRPLSPVEALGAYMPAVYMPGWDIGLTEMVMETLDEMLPPVPIFEMSCDISSAAVRMAAEALSAL